VDWGKHCGYLPLAMPYSTDLVQHFDEVTDPRRGEPVYPLTNILFMTICAVIAGSDDFVAIAKYAQTKKVWFSKILDLSTGIASHGRFYAILASIKPAEFGKALPQWITSPSSFKLKQRTLICASRHESNSVVLNSR